MEKLKTATDLTDSVSDNGSQNEGHHHPSELQRAATAVRTELVDLWHSSLRGVHVEVVKKSAVLVLVLITAVMAMLSIYWGSFHNRHNRMHNLKVWVLDFDNSTVGRSVVEFMTPYAASGAPTTFGFEVVSTGEYGGDVATVLDDIVDEKAWAAIAIAPNATISLTNAVAGAGTTAKVFTEYLIQYIYNTGRAEGVAFQTMLPVINGLKDAWTQQFAAQWLQSLAATLSPQNLSELATSAPGLVAEPVTWTFVDVRPYKGDISPAILVTGLIYLIIVSFYQVPHFQRVHPLISSRVKLVQAMTHRFLLNGLSMFILSLFFSLVSLAFGADFSGSAKYGRGGFVVYWLTNFMAMWALGGASENMVSCIMAVFPPGLGYWLAFWVASNSATSFSPLELSPRVYRIGKALPVHNAQQAIRTVLFNTKSHVAVNFGVFAVWIVVNYLFSFVAVTFIKYWRGRVASKAALKSATQV